MKKKIEKPEVKVLRLQETNVIATSSTTSLSKGFTLSGLNNGGNSWYGTITNN